MHDQTAEGNDFFKCDYCRRPWADDRPMVEGHQGSLVCGQCLTVAYIEIVGGADGAPPTAPNAGTLKARDEVCRMCLVSQDEPAWRSPLFDDALICRRCIKQSAGVLEQDDELHWRRPGKA